jgi:transmembrane sensor
MDAMAKAEDTSRQTGLPDRDAYDWVARFASGDASQKDIDDLKRWAARDPAHAEAFDRASRAWQTIGTAASETPHPAGAMRVVRPSRRLFISGALAASAAAATVVAVRPPLDLWPSWSELAADYRTDIGERRQIKLFDNIAVDMNTRTSIAMLPSTFGDDRIELLTGEAVVATPLQSSSALTVVAGGGHIVARRARFNVRRDPASVCVTCIDGETTIERNSARQILTAGQQIVYSDQGVGVTSAADTGTVTAWQGGLMIFKAMPVADVVVEVNRYRRGRIILTNAALGRERFSARFRIENVDQVVHQIEHIFNARVTALPGGIILLG